MTRSGAGTADDAYWIGLTLVPEIGPVTAGKLLRQFGNPRTIFTASRHDLMAVPGMSESKAVQVSGFSRWKEVDGHLDVLARNGVAVIGYHDTRYPAALREIDGAPVVLYQRGDYIPEDRFGVAVVGSRRNTVYGETVTQRIAGRLAAAGLTIISGMARGIDTIAHRSALSSKGRTIAVLGSGPETAYPPENRGLMEEIAAAGAVLTEFLPGTKPNPENFPRRNRLISGLSLGVLVVEATAGSGSLITASCALEQNKDVFAVPGNVTARSSEGTNRLIRDGARVVLDADDILEELAPALKGFLKAESRAQLTETEETVCAALSAEPRQIDHVARETALPVSRLLDLLLGLELKGIVRQTEGKRFYLAWGGVRDGKAS